MTRFPQQLEPNGTASGAGRSGQTTRRAFLTASATIVGAGAVWYLRRSAVFAASPAGPETSLPGTVTIINFAPNGKRSGRATVPSISRSDAEWRQQLSPISYQVARQAGTERPYTGDTWDEHGRGLFRCVCCDTALFSSDTKFDSGTGWPSFWQVIAKENVVETSDTTLGIERTAVSCRRCAAHLGHVFDDGPRPTGLRYCMNSAALHFVRLTA